ncbi:hypothetical protein [Paraburkholderia sp. J11-2]|uniref:hypothetical protein n=1 Tax=Paraburkholderia sp. J11-2 TaxID=2805431 RepID=UPI002AB7DE7E|nr:hypothetical protein [Paraburkholderia sp. J11-2]
MVIGVYRASLTIAGDAHIARAAHRDAFPYCLTFGQTPIQRGALRHAWSGPILYFRWPPKGRHLFPYSLTLNIFVQPVIKVRRRQRNPGFGAVAGQKICCKAIAPQQNTRVARARQAESPDCEAKNYAPRQSKVKIVEVRRCVPRCLPETLTFCRVD